MIQIPERFSLPSCRGIVPALAVLVALLSTPAALAQDPAPADLQALRFYIDQGNEGAVEAELQRLRAVFPNWTPPSDLDALVSSSVPVEVQRIYDLIGAGEYDAARALITQTDAAYDDWSPPADMLNLLSVSEAQRDFDAFVSAGNADGVIRIARGIPALLSCERVNNPWELAEAHIARGNPEEALRIYRGIVETCSDPSVLVATLEKANAVASLETLADLSARAQSTLPAAAGIIRQAEERLRSARGSQTPQQNEENVIAVPSQPTAPRQPAAPSSGGLSEVQRAAQAGDWARCLALTAQSTQAALVYQRGWCAYNLDRPLEAITAFETAIRQLPSSDQRRDAGYGLLLSMLSMNMTEQAAQFAATAPLTRAQRVAIEGQILDQRGVEAFENGQYARAVAFFRAHRQLVGTTRRDLALLEGYALLNMGDRAGARRIFQQLHDELATRETRQAIRAAN